MKLNSCHNREPLQETVIVQEGWNYCRDGFGNPVRSAVLREIPNPMTKDCQYSKTTADARCAGCKWKQELETK